MNGDLSCEIQIQPHTHRCLLRHRMFPEMSYFSLTPTSVYEVIELNSVASIYASARAQLPDVSVWHLGYSST